MASKFRLLYNYGLGILGLKQQDVILASFPKSGNTWVRFFYANLISEIYLDGKVIYFKILDEMMPEVGVSNLLKDWKFSKLPRLVKTHNNYWPLYRSNRSILVVRDPKDVMVSYYHFEKKKKQPFEGDFQSFLRSPKYGLINWFKHYESWKNQADIILRFEDLKTNDLDVFKDLIRNITEVSIPNKKVENAILKSRFDKIREIENKYGHPNLQGHKSTYKFTRKGEIGTWNELFSAADIEYYNELKQAHGLRLY